MDEKFVWQQFLLGKQSALAEIFLAFHDDLLRYGLKLTGNQNLVQDCVQDLFLKLWKNRDNLKEIQKVKPYLIKSLRNHLIDSLELQKPHFSITDDSIQELPLTYSHEDFLIQGQVAEETQQQVVAALNKLPLRQKEVIYLRFFEELDFDTIAMVMDMNVQSVRNTLSRGLQFIRDLMLMQPFLLMLGKSHLILSDFF